MRSRMSGAELDGGFLEKEAAIKSRSLHPFSPKTASGNGPEDTRPRTTAGPASKDNDKALPSPWIPSLTPEAETPNPEKPSRTAIHPLRMSAGMRKRVSAPGLWAPRGSITHCERCACAVTHHTLSCCVPRAVLQSPGAKAALGPTE